MAEAEDKRHYLEDDLDQVVALLREQRVEAEGDRRQGVAPRVASPALAELERQLNAMHPADVAHILEMLPVDDRLMIWDLIKQELDGEILLEVSDAVRETLIANMEADELVAATEQLDADEIADLAPDLPREVMDDVFESLSVEEREQLRAAMSYPEDSVGALMDFDMIGVREDVTVEVVLRYLRRRDELPDHTDQLFVVDRDEKLRGILAVNRLLVSSPDTLIGSIMTIEDIVTLRPEDEAHEAALSFERYDLVSAPVVGGNGKLVARVTIAAVVDFINERRENEMLSAGGLSEDEDLFAPVWNSVKNRWTWLALNLVTAFVASRVIGIFEHSIEKAGGARRPHADHRGHRRQFGQPDHHDDRSWSRARADHRRQCTQAAYQGVSRLGIQRARLGHRGGGVRLPHLSQLAAGSRDDGRHATQPHAGCADGLRDSDDDAQARSRSGARRERDDHGHHR
jgi:magnesium transporter